jgi:hypothetical protein
MFDGKPSNGICQVARLSAVTRLVAGRTDRGCA